MTSKDVPDTFSFEKVNDEHLAMMHEWLGKLHITRWWGDPDHELELIRTGRASGEADGYMYILLLVRWHTFKAGRQAGLMTNRG